MQIYYFMLYFYVYGFLGWCTEVCYASLRERRFVNRGFLNGPICPVYGVGVGIVVFLLAFQDWGLVSLYVVSTGLVTTIEGVTGYLMDKIFHHKWWDYSNQPLNIGGYVCLMFSLAWGIACVLIVRVIHPVIYRGLTWIPFTFGIVILVILSAALFSDICTTTAGIIKLNKKLEMMEKIAVELKEISDLLGENLHENVMETLERSEEARIHLDMAASELREKWEAISDEKKEILGERAERIEEKLGSGLFSEDSPSLKSELKEKYLGLKCKYEELSEKSGRITKRLVGAFPRMESRFYKEHLIELKKYIWK